MQTDFENLVLLMGTNPLPNYIVAEHFINTNDNLKRIVLLYSKKSNSQHSTEKFATNLESLLKQNFSPKPPFSICTIQLEDVGSPSQIKNDLEENLDRNLIPLNKTKTVHLNYTGGTKVMSVHVYKFIENLKNAEPSFSYFDGREFKIACESSNIFISPDLRNESRIDFKSILTLHGLELIKTKTDHNKIFPDETMGELKKQIDEKKGEQLKNEILTFFHALNKIIKYKKISSKTNQDKIRQLLPDVEKENPQKSPLFLLLTAMDERFQLLNETGNLDFEKLPHYENRLKMFLNGIWLEHYIYWMLKKHYGSINGIEIKQNQEIKSNCWNTHFQVDVILKMGYLLTGISCTISSKKNICKQKGFEIIHRSRQMGGDEARAILVTFLDESAVDTLQYELERDSGCPQGYFKVLGKDHLSGKILYKCFEDLLPHIKNQYSPHRGKESDV
jgi:hypothetical protein